jgi:hypothetical protein
VAFAEQAENVRGSGGATGFAMGGSFSFCKDSSQYFWGTLDYLSVYSVT